MHAYMHTCTLWPGPGAAATAAMIASTTCMHVWMHACMHAFIQVCMYACS